MPDGNEQLRDMVVVQAITHVAALSAGHHEL